MPDDNRFSDDDKNPKRGSEFRVPPRTWIVWIAIFGGIILLMLARERMDSQGEVLPQSAFLMLVDSNRIEHAILTYSPQNSALIEITGRYYRGDKPENSGGKVKDSDLVPFRLKARLPQKVEDNLLVRREFEVREPNTMLLNVLWSILPI